MEEPTSPALNLDFDQLSDQALESQLTRHAANVNAATCQLLLMIAEFDRRSAWGNEGVRSCAHWLNWRCGISMGAAREKVRVANALADLPKICDAFASGQLSYSKARAITRVATANNETCLLSYAQYGSASQVERVVRLYRQQYLDANSVKLGYNDVVLPGIENDDVDPATAERLGAAHRVDHRMLDTHWDEHGCLVIRARLTADQGAVVLRAIEAAVESLKQDNAEQTTDSIPQAHDKNVSAGTHQLDIDSAVRHAQNRRADALVLMAESLLQHNHTTSSTADRFQVIVHVDQQVLAKAIHASSSGEPDCYIENQVSIPVDTARRLSCDCKLVAAVCDGTEPLAIGRRSRSITPAIDRVLRIRDAHCQFPGCACTNHLDAHHIIHWSNGGETSLDNLMLLCHHHHTLLHEGGFSVQQVNSVRVFTRPDGTGLYTEAGIEKSSGPVDDTQSDVWSWCGDSMDYSSALYCLDYDQQHGDHCTTQS